MSGVNLQAIYDRLASAPKYHPLSANTFADWSMEAGDVVTVSRDGTDYSSPVGTMTMRWTGKQQIQIQSEGSRERDPISRVSARKYATGGGGTSGIRANQSLYYEMFSKDGQLHAVVSATAESLTSDYSKKIEDQNIELRGVVTQTAESLTSDYSMKIGDLDDALRGVIRQTAESLTSDYSDKIEKLGSHFEQRAGQIELSVENLDKRLSAQINVTDRTASMSVGRVKFSNTEHYANKSGFPATGVAGTLYYADDTRKAYLYMPGTHSYELAEVDEYGNANYIKAGEIAISINESGNTEAKLDADVIYAGRNTKQTLAGLELPDWMDTTEGLIAEKATIVDLKAIDARVETLEADTLMTKNLSAAISNLSLVTVKGLKGGNITSDGYIESDTIRLKSGAQHGLSEAFIGVQLDGPTNNKYTLKFLKADGNWYSIQPSFSRATSLRGTWSSDKFTVKATPQDETYDVKITIDQNFVPSGQQDAITIVKPSATGANWLRVQQQVGDLSSGKRTIKTIVGSTTIEETEISDASDAWSLARGKVSIPSSGSGGGITAKWPGSSYNTQDTRTYTLMEDGSDIVGLYYNSAAAGQPANYVKAAQLNHNEYTTGKNNGWDLARGKVSIPGSGSGGSITASWPNSSYDSKISRTYTLMEDGYNIVGLYYNSAAAGQAANYVKVAQLNHNEYTAGRNSVKLQAEKYVTSNGDVYPDAGYDGMSKVTVDVPTGGEISIPRGDIYTTDRTPSGTNASTLRNNYEQARSDGDYVVFHVTCGDASRWYYMEP